MGYLNFFKSKQNIFAILSVLTISLFIILKTISLTKYSCFFDDDEYYLIIEGLKYSDIFKSLTFNEHGGGYFGYFLCKFMCFLLPLKIGIHPANFIASSEYNFIKGLFIAFVLLFMAKFAIVYNKTKMFFVLSYFFICFYFMFAVLEHVAPMFLFNYNLYRYFFSIIFFSYLICFILRNIEYPNNFLKLNKTGTKELIFASFCAYVTGTSSEMLFTATLILYIFLGVITAINNKNYVINKIVFIPFIFFIIALFLFTSSSGFINTASGRGFLNTSITVNSFLEFSKFYFLIYFKQYFCYWLVCFAVIIMTLLYYKNSIRNLIFPALIQLSILIAYFSLILCNNEQNNYVTNNCYYFISHTNLIFLFRMIMIIPLFIYISSILDQIKHNKDVLYKILFILLTLFSFYFMLLNIKNPLFNSIADNLKTGRQTNYKIDKLYKFQTLKGLKHSIPKSLLDLRPPLRNDRYGYYYAWVWYMVIKVF